MRVYWCVFKLNRKLHRWLCIPLAHYYIFKPSVGNSSILVTIHRRCRLSSATTWVKQMAEIKRPSRNPRKSASRATRRVDPREKSFLKTKATTRRRAARQAILFTAWWKLHRRRCIYSSWINGASRESLGARLRSSASSLSSAVELSVLLSFSRLCLTDTHTYIYIERTHVWSSVQSFSRERSVELFS